MSTIRVVNIQHTDATEPNIVLEADGTTVFASGITISGGTNLTVSGTAEFASGTVSAPSITFIDDNNTGIYEPAADTVAITTAATERLRIDSSGKVGIGTTSPAGKLTLKTTNSNGATTAWDNGYFVISEGDTGTSFGLGLSLDTTNNEAHISSLTPGTQWEPINYRASQHKFFVTDASSNEVARIDSSGRLLVGTSSGQGKFIVQDNSLPKIQANYNGAAHIEFGVGGTGCGFTMTTGHFMSFNHQPYADRGTDNNLTERMRILGTGGLTFNGDTAAANALDDYEEGTWTPAFVNAGTATYAVQIGHYSKVGNVVTATLFLQLASLGTASGNVAISGFPFLTKNVTNLYAISSSFHGTSWNVTRNSMNVIIAPGQTTTNVFYYNMAAAGSAYGQVQHSDLGTGNTLISFTYLAN
jgi:hypothetical protein